MSRLVFRADGDSSIGLGHVMRCLALATILKVDFENIVFAIRQPSIQVTENIAACGAELWNLKNDKQDFLPRLTSQDIVVLDGYGFNESYRRSIKEIGCKLVCIDDLHEEFITADVIINHALSAKPGDYQVAPYTKLCLGAGYAMLRPPFGSLNNKREVTAAKDIFICFGGADPENITLRALEAAVSTPPIVNIHVVVGSAYMHGVQLAKFVQQQNAKSITVHQNLNAADMAAVMQECDIAIAPSSTVAYELGSVGIGFITGMQADNQQYIHSALVEDGLAKSLGDFRHVTAAEITSAITSLDIETIHKQISFQQKTFKNSANNFRKAFQKLSLEQECRIKRATIDDLQLYFTWVNDAEVRKHSVNTNPVSIENHTKWFTAKRSSPNHFFYILEHKGVPAGQLRFDKQGNTYTINYSLDKDFRGRGLGEVIVRLSIENLCKETGAIPLLYAIVKKDNPASQKAFQNNNFVRQDDTVIEGISYDVYTR